MNPLADEANGPIDLYVLEIEMLKAEIKELRAALARANDPTWQPPHKR